MKNLSIIIPIYNAEAFLPRCLDSILAEKMASMEVILVNDGSSDASSNICAHYAEQDSRVVCINQENRGAVAARNKGMDIACGTYLLFADADDYVSPGYVASLYETALATTADIVFCQVHRIRSGKLIESASYVAGTRVNLSERLALLKETYYPGPCAKIYRRDLLEENDIHFLSEEGYFGFAEDMLLALHATYTARKIAFCPSAIYYYCMDNENSLCSDPSIQQRNNKDRLVIIGHMLRFAQDKGLSGEELLPILQAVENHLRWGGKDILRTFMSMLDSWNLSIEAKNHFYRFSLECERNKTLSQRIKNSTRDLLLRFPHLYRLALKIKSRWHH